MHQQLRTFKSQIDKLKSSLDRSRLIADSQQRLNDRPANMSAVRRFFPSLPFTGKEYLQGVQLNGYSKKTWRVTSSAWTGKLSKRRRWPDHYLSA